MDDFAPTSHWFSFENDVVLQPILNNRFMTRKMKDALILKQERRVSYQRKAWISHVQNTLVPAMKQDPKGLYDRTKIIRICVKNVRIVFAEEIHGSTYMMTWLLQFWWRTYGKKRSTRTLVRNYFENGLTLCHKSLSYEELLVKCQCLKVARSTRLCLIRMIFICGHAFGFTDCECFHKYLSMDKLDTKKFMFAFVVHFYPYHSNARNSEISGNLYDSATQLVTNFNFICMQLIARPGVSCRQVLLDMMASETPCEDFLTPNALLPMICNFFQKFIGWLNYDVCRKQELVSTTMEELQDFKNAHLDGVCNSMSMSIDAQLSELKDNLELLNRFPEAKKTFKDTEIEVFVAGSLIQSVRDKRMDMISIHMLSLDPEFRYDDSNLEKYHLSLHLAKIDLNDFWRALLHDIMGDEIALDNVRLLLDSIKGELIQHNLENFQDFIKFFAVGKFHNLRSSKEDTIQFCCDEIKGFGDILLANLKDSHQANGSFLWRNAYNFTQDGKKRLFRCCKVLYMMTRFFCIQELNVKLDNAAPFVSGEGLLIERIFFDERLASGFKTPVLQKIMMHIIDTMELSASELIVLLNQLEASNITVKQIVCRSFYFFLVSNQILEPEEPMTYLETFYLDQPDLLDFQRELLFIQFMMVFIPLMMANALPVLKRQEFELCEAQYIRNVRVLRETLESNILEVVDLEIKSNVTFIRDFMRSNCMRNIQESFYDSGLFLDDEIVEILNLAVNDFQQNIFGQRFVKM